jgi:hypothetical protein
MQLLISQKLRGSTTGIRYVKSGGISGADTRISHCAQKNCGTLDPVRLQLLLPLLSLKRDCCYRNKMGFLGELLLKRRGLRGLLCLSFYVPRSIEQVNATYMLRGFCGKAGAITKLETDTVGTNNKINRRQLLLSLKLRTGLCF